MLLSSGVVKHLCEYYGLLPLLPHRLARSQVALPSEMGRRYPLKVCGMNQCGDRRRPYRGDGIQTPRGSSIVQHSFVEDWIYEDNLP